ncbi:bifunctional dethiobiotin synthetase/7,8-diamino-pelargonic acid aminotransferase, mitochondrial [Dorcoceras hygrometricum]|uniref:Bifunctional dethiobiotin synthetase/7,8-diamino-pelargonic acid aminotransferase, mitochondrial n=1 Tax=Dorcoceras hygrometricum TaxID=472368 RepID=A0A2Z7A565_9LAMI|nr:bifunctional dethiobiotin synthetase/7,8-diamino-pelargonic acid aminotransferase, mitochondrial [Dorcoceras hygrometricum]
MTFRVVRTNQYNQDLGLIHSTNGNHLESPKEGSSIDHQVSVAQDAVPLQIIEPTPVAKAEQPTVLTSKSKKRNLRLPKGSDDENVEERVAVENVENVEKPITVDVTVGEIVVEPTEEDRHASAQLETTDDVDVIIEQVIAETSQLATDEGDQYFAETNVGEIVFGDTPVDKADDLEQWFDRSYEVFVSRDTEQLIVSTSDLDKGTVTAETVAGEQQVPMFVEKETFAESEGNTVILFPADIVRLSDIASSQILLTVTAMYSNSDGLFNRLRERKI